MFNIIILVRNGTISLTKSRQLPLLAEHMVFHALAGTIVHLIDKNKPQMAEMIRLLLQ